MWEQQQVIQSGNLSEMVVLRLITQKVSCVIEKADGIPRAAFMVAAGPRDRSKKDFYELLFKKKENLQSGEPRCC